MLNIGKMDKRISLDRYVGTVNSAGYREEQWEIMAMVWAELLDLSADEFSTGYGEGENETAVFRIRYRSDLTTQDRVTYDGTKYDLKQIKTVGRKEALELRCEVTQ